MNVLVLGGYGAVGQQLTAELRAAGMVALAAGRDPAKADRVVDLTEPDQYRAALSGVDVVVNAAGAEDPRLVLIAAREGAAFVDVSATTAYIEALDRLDLPQPAVVNVGLAPGLTNLLAAAVHAETGGPVDIAVLLGAGEKHGAAAMDWSFGLLGTSFDDHGRTIRNYSQPRSFDLPRYGRRTLLRVDFSDQHALSRDLGVPVRTFFGLDSRLATTALRVLTWLPGAAKAPRGVHFAGSDDWLVLARSQDHVRWAHGRNQSKATATVAAVAVRAAVSLPAGVHHLHTIATLADVPGVELNRNR